MLGRRPGRPRLATVLIAVAAVVAVLAPVGEAIAFDRPNIPPNSFW
jgi:hypothetical protein